jgi:Uma2 family endonuclease
MRELNQLVGDRRVVRGQEPIILSTDSEPKPDVVIAKGEPDDYLDHHPYPSDVLLVIEVSGLALNYDQTTKLGLYAECRIKDYWIVNLVNTRLERYSQPYSDQQGGFGYRMMQISLAHETVALPHDLDLLLELGRIFPQE